MRRVRNGLVGERSAVNTWLPDRRPLYESQNVADNDWPGLIPNIRAQKNLQDTPVLQLKWMLVTEVVH